MPNERPIRLAIAGIGNCASSLIEGLAFYRQNPDNNQGLLFPSLGGYSARDIEVVAAFDVSVRKVGKPIQEAIYEAPNNFLRIPAVQVKNEVIVQRGPTLDGNPKHLAEFVPESEEPAVDVPAVLRESHAEILVNLLPTGSLQATQFYAEAALEAGCLSWAMISRVNSERPFCIARCCKCCNYAERSSRRRRR